MNYNEKEVSKLLQSHYQDAIKDISGKIAVVLQQMADHPDPVVRQQHLRNYKRLNSLLENIKLEYQTLRQKVKTITVRASGDAFKDGHESIANLLAEAKSKNLIETNLVNFEMLPKDAIEKAVQSELSGMPINMRLKKITEENWGRIRTAVTQGIIRGDSYDKMVKGLSDVYGKDRASAERVIRTETHRTMVEGTLYGMDRAQDKGIEFDRKWVATIDNRTRDRHGELDGEIADKEGFFHLGGLKARGPSQWGQAELDINCRCAVIALIPGMEPKERRIRNEDGNGSTLQGYKTFKEFSSQHSIPSKTKASKKIDLSDLELIKIGSVFIADFKRNFPDLEPYEYALLNALRKRREFGTQLNVNWAKGSIVATIKKIEQQMNFFPSDWWGEFEKQELNKMSWKATSPKRGYFSFREKKIAINSKDIFADSTAIHELSHLMESFIPQLGIKQKEFWERRTKGESFKRLRNIFKNPGYAINEICKEDHFSHAYMGKYYDGNHWEILSMGMEILFKKKLSSLRGIDKEFENFIIGVLLSL